MFPKQEKKVFYEIYLKNIDDHVKLLFLFYLGNLYIPVIWEAELKPTKEKYPVIIFSHGLSGWRCTYSAICLELASRGYVVAALEHR